jgi:hypothetical protein
MVGVLDEVPWGNLWRTVVSTCLFFGLLGMPLAIFTSLDEGETAAVFQFVVLLVAAILAAIVVWSEKVSWVGDT